MLGPKTENSVSGSQNVNQIGHNSGTVTIGLTFEQHELNVRHRLAELRADLERAHGAERAVQQAQLDAVQASLGNLQADYQKTLTELAELKATLAGYDDVLDRRKLAEADAALDRGDRTLARALLMGLAAKARSHKEAAAKDEAALEFKLGQIAEAEIRWHDAAAHFATAAQLNPSFEALIKACQFARHAGNYSAAFDFSEKLLGHAKADGTQEQLAAALNEHALTLLDQAEYVQAEGLVRQALAVDEVAIGTSHPDYATHVNNLASVIERQGRYAEAECLYRQALTIDEATIGTAHPDYAIDLSNLAGVLALQGHHAEAEGLYRQALAIGEATLGSAHPAHANRLNNLAGVVRRKGRCAEAADYYRQAVEVSRERLGDEHPQTQTVTRNLLKLLRSHFPDDPDIPALQARLTDKP